MIRKSGRSIKPLLCFSFLTLSALLFNSCGKNYSTFCREADSYLEDSKFQGTVLVARGNKIIFQKGCGSSDPKSKNAEPNSVNTVFETGSISKQMTAACIMQLIEKKKLSLDDTLVKFFPELSETGFADRITVRMLLSMRSGLVDHINSPEEFFGPKLARKIEKIELGCKNVERDLVLKTLETAPLLAEPDSTYFYCNTNYYLLALIIESVSGLSYEDYMEKNIFRKAKMTSSNTTFQETTARGYIKNRYYSIPKNMALGCGDVNSTATDLLLWNSALYGGKIVSKKSLKAMTDSDSYGFGLYCSQDSFLHAGNTQVFNSYMEFFPKEKISLIVLSNKPVSELNATVTGGKLRKMLFPSG